MRLACLALPLLLFGCDSSVPEATPLDGSYVEFGGRDLMDGDVISAGIAGVYVQRVLDLSEGRFVVEVASDWPPEVGTATGAYSVDGDQLRLHVESSSSSLYPARSVVAYDEALVLDGQFRDSLSWAHLGLTFDGPGLALVQYTADVHDYDGDGDRDERVTAEAYYTRRR